MLFVKKPESNAEVNAAIAELEALKQQQAAQQHANRERAEALAAARAEVEKLVPARAKEIEDAWHQWFAAELKNGALAQARAQLEFELVDPIRDPPATTKQAETRRLATDLMRRRLYHRLRAPWEQRPGGTGGVA